MTPSPYRWETDRERRERIIAKQRQTVRVGKFLYYFVCPWLYPLLTVANWILGKLIPDTKKPEKSAKENL